MMNILFVAAEAAPFAKVGGLGDVVGALPWALKTAHPEWDIRLVLPLHPTVDVGRWGAQPLTAFTIAHRNGPITAEIYHTEHRGLEVYFVTGGPVLAVPGVYSPDPRADAVKYAFFSLATLALARYLNWQPDILHAHDWHTALAVHALVARRPYDAFFAATRTVLTVHNLPYMGAASPWLLEAFGLPPAPLESGLPPWAQTMPLPLGLAAADAITTVSPTYAREMLTPAFGRGLEDFLKTRRERLWGILNGLDTDLWNPSTDPALDVRYTASTLALRERNAEALRQEVGLPQPEGRMPLVGLVSRLTEQKGVDVVAEALRLLADSPWQAVLLGTGEPQWEDALRQLEVGFPDRVRAVLRYDDGLARRIYASADVLMVPSRYEPCGLAQMIAMRYGAVPVATETGGLADTVRDVDLSRRSTGFLLPEATPKALAFALRRAFARWADRRRWQALQRRGMAEDFSWDKPAQAYARLYARLLAPAPDP
ncbi:MAG TPA: glycogen synthase [Chloroflexi bacterium]|nr:glycogen synthase [Chloroflexota bacterium]